MKSDGSLPSLKDPYDGMPLDSQRGEIRLVRVQPGKDPDTISCTLHACVLEESSPPYMALDYTFGDATVFHDIALNGSRATVDHNLWCFLRLARRVTQYRNMFFWINTLSINQSNLQEKDDQSQVVSRIYETAEWIVIFSYLVTDAYGTDRDMGMQSSRTILTPKDKTSASILKSHLSYAGNGRHWITAMQSSRRVPKPKDKKSASFINSYLSQAWNRRHRIVDGAIEIQQRLVMYVNKDSNRRNSYKNSYYKRLQRDTIYQPLSTIALQHPGRWVLQTFTVRSREAIAYFGTNTLAQLFFVSAVNSATSPGWEMTLRGRAILDVGEALPGLARSVDFKTMSGIKQFTLVFCSLTDFLIKGSEFATLDQISNLVTWFQPLLPTSTRRAMLAALSRNQPRLHTLVDRLFGTNTVASTLYLIRDWQGDQAAVNTELRLLLEDVATRSDGQHAIKHSLEVLSRSFSTAPARGLRQKHAGRDPNPAMDLEVYEIHTAGSFYHGGIEPPSDRSELEELSKEEHEGREMSALTVRKSDLQEIGPGRADNASRKQVAHRLFPWVKRWLRPGVAQGYRRIEWECDCGSNLHADLPIDYGSYIDELASSLQKSEPTLIQPTSFSDNSDAKSTTIPHEDSVGYESSAIAHSKSRTTLKIRLGKKAELSRDSNEQEEDNMQGCILFRSFLALCINSRGAYKVCSEIPIAKVASDAQLFLDMKSRYIRERGIWSCFNVFVKPTSVEFIEFNFWNFKNSYISVRKRPNCIPPRKSREYDFQPRTLEPPPMPPEVFIHYLEHGEGDLNPLRNDWIGHLPKRLSKHDSQCVGYGIHIIEGPNKLGIFLITMVILICTIVVAVAYSVMKNDVQGGTGIAALVVASYTSFLTAWIFWRSGTGS